MNKHLPLVALRFVIAYGISVVLPFAHARWGQRYPGDGQEAFAFIVVFMGIGMAAAAFYFVTGSLLHYLRRHRSRLGIFKADALLGAVIAAVLAIAGVTATYHDAPASGRARDCATIDIASL